MMMIMVTILTIAVAEYLKKKHLLKFCDHLGSLYAVMRYAIGKRFSCSETFPDDHKLPWSIVNYRDHADDYDHDVDDHDQFEVDHDVYDHNNYALDDDVNVGNHHLAEESQCCRFCFSPSQTLAELAISAGKIKVDDNDDILTPRIRDSYCSCCVTEKTG